MRFEKRMLLNVFHLGHRMPESLFFIESTMSEKLYEFISKELEEFRERSLFRQIPPVDSGADKFLVFEGRRLLNLASNNYLGIADHPDLKAAAAQAVEQYGTSSGHPVSSPEISVCSTGLKRKSAISRGWMTRLSWVPASQPT